MRFLETHVVPVCRFAFEGERCYIKSQHGTAFFVSGDGLFLTAGHVLDEVGRAVETLGGFAGLCAKAGTSGEMPGSIAAKITSFDRAAPPSDIAIGRAQCTCEPCFGLGVSRLEIWSPVAALGYPISASAVLVGDYRLNIRGHKGYVQRLLRPGDYSIGDHPHAIEVDFAITPGMSGAPLFSPDFGLHGVCWGSARSENVDFEISERSADGSTHRERSVRVVEYGIAHRVDPLLDWAPGLLDGLSLRQLLSPRESRS